MQSQVLRSSPPRNLHPLTVLVTLFGGAPAFGFIFIAFGSIFVWVFGAQSEAAFWIERAHDWRPIEATLTAVEPTNMSENESVIYRYVYSYELDWQTYTGEAFGFGGGQAGQRIPVEFAEGSPEISRAPGMRRAPFADWTLLLVMIFPLIGMGFVGFGLWKNLRLVRLLKRGVFTWAECAAREPTNMSINDRPVFKYTFRFTVGGRVYDAVGKTHEIELLEDEETERVLYDPHNPAYNIVYDTYSNAPDIDARGQLVAPTLRQSGPIWVVLFIIVENIVLYWLTMT